MAEGARPPGPVILILAAGASSRMRGRDKLLEDVGGEPLLARQCRIAAATGRPVHVALPPAPHARRALVGPAAIVDVPRAAEGMGRSIATGVAALTRAPAILLLLADLPELETADLVAVLAAGPGLARGATAPGAPGHPILIPRAAYPDFLALEGDDGGRAALAGRDVTLVPLPAERARRDLDTPEAWASWRAERGGTRGRTRTGKP